MERPIHIYMGYCTECYFPTMILPGLQWLYSHHKTCNREEGLVFCENELESALTMRIITDMIRPDLN